MQRAGEGGFSILRLDHAADREEGLGAFFSETDLPSPKSPLVGPWDPTIAEEPRRESIERWGALAQDMRALNAKVQTLSGSIRTLTYLAVGLMLLTSFLLFVTLTFAARGADLWNLYADIVTWR